MGTLKDLLPPDTIATAWYPFYAIDTAKSKSFAQEVEKRMKTYPIGPAPVGYIAGRMIIEAIRKSGTADDVDQMINALGTVRFEGPTGPVKVRSCDNMALYDFYVGVVKRAPGPARWHRPCRHQDLQHRSDRAQLRRDHEGARWRLAPLVQPAWRCSKSAD